jgi:oligoribonuclease
MIWIDCETTGLSDESSIIEMAVAQTDIAGNILASKNWVIRPHKLDLRMLDEKVVAMHTANGLFAECVRNTAISFGQADSLLGAFIEEHGEVGSPLCGSSVHFDRKFLMAAQSTAITKLHYRNFDVSTLIQFIQSIDPSFDLNVPGGLEHRALPDIHRSIALYRRIRDSVLLLREQARINNT